MDTYRPFRRFAIAVAVLCACTIAAGATAVAILGHRGAHPSPSPVREEASVPDGFPEVDWEFWLKVNPSVIGWITIPGTAVNNPIVQATREDPGFYLAHDVYGGPNYTGCPFLDAACADTGGLLRCPNSVVYGHNMGWSQDMFGDLELFIDERFAKAHRNVLLQTPTEKLHLDVQAVAVIPGWDALKRIDFTSESDFETWWNERFAEADVQLASKPRVNRNLLTLCTCSYSRWDNERTLVYCMAA